jgi:hypothetical protein
MAFYFLRGPAKAFFSSSSSPSDCRDWLSTNFIFYFLKQTAYCNSLEYVSVCLYPYCKLSRVCPINLRKDKTKFFYRIAFWQIFFFKIKTKIVLAKTKSLRLFWSFIGLPPGLTESGPPWSGLPKFGIPNLGLENLILQNLVFQSMDLSIIWTFPTMLSGIRAS